MAVAPADQDRHHLFIRVTIRHIIAPVFHLDQRLFERDRLAALMLIGTEHPLVETGRRSLARVLFADRRRRLSLCGSSFYRLRSPRRIAPPRPLFGSLLFD